ncbi:hypothetical protein K439DRAFT_1616637 [Ramaria rubella]|nr:hypothetical protein K439DRAFT_1616637 [Ramaria rubella]
MAEHAAAYTEYMQRYLRSLKELFPDEKLRDNHHVTLHLEELIIAFGPVHSWWAFPFEWLIGQLEDISTNWKLGQMEVTMMSTFCAALGICTLLSSVHQIPAVSLCADLVKGCFPEAEIHVALAIFLCHGSPTCLHRDAQLHNQIKHHGHKYSTALATIRDSLVMLHGRDDILVPGHIHQIFTHSHQSI